MKGAYIFLADGFEDIEALGTLDILRRGGVAAATVSINKGTLEVTSAHGVTVLADMSLHEFFDAAPGTDAMLVFPGGLPGAANLAECAPLMDLAKRHFADGGPVAAICAAPGLVASQLPGIRGLKVTCYDGFEGFLQDKGAVYTGEGTVTDGRLITGRGPAFAIPFGLAIVSFLQGADVAESVRKGLLLT